MKKIWKINVKKTMKNFWKKKRICCVNKKTSRVAPSFFWVTSFEKNKTTMVIYYINNININKKEIYEKVFFIKTKMRNKNSLSRFMKVRKGIGKHVMELDERKKIRKIVRKKLIMNIKIILKNIVELIKRIERKN